MGETLYVVTADGIKHSYGGYIYLIGVYDTKEKAQKVCDENKDWEADVTEITVNTTYPLTKDRCGDYWNKHLLGGHEG